MENTSKSLAQTINLQAADKAAMQLVLMAIARQIPDTKKLISDFSYLAENQETMTMFSGRPESFFVQLQASNAQWMQLFLEQLDAV